MAASLFIWYLQGLFGQLVEAEPERSSDPGHGEKSWVWRRPLLDAAHGLYREPGTPSYVLSGEGWRGIAARPQQCRQAVASLAVIVGVCSSWNRITIPV